jgi:hypothetical protein
MDVYEALHDLGSEPKQFLFRIINHNNNNNSLTNFHYVPF